MRRVKSDDVFDQSSLQQEAYALEADIELARRHARGRSRIPPSADDGRARELVARWCLVYGRKYALAKGTDPTAAEDFAAEYAIRVDEKLHQWRREGPLKAWCRVVCRNLHITLIVRPSRSPAPEPLTPDLEDTGLGPEQTAMWELTKGLILEALGGEGRRVYVEGDTQKQVAETLGTGQPRVAERLQKARERVKRALLERYTPEALRELAAKIAPSAAVEGQD